MRRLRLPFALLVLAAAAFFAASGQWPWRRFEVAPPPVDVLPAMNADVAAPSEPEYFEIADTLRRGETLSDLFARQGVRGIDLAALRPVLDPRRLRAGLVFNFRREATDSQPSRIVVRASPDTRLLFQRASSGWSTEHDTIAWAPEVLRIEGAIDASLYEALDDEVADSALTGPERMRLAWEIADIYAWQVDFTRDLQQGDRFQVVLERLVSDEGEIRFGRILATDLTMSGKQLTAFRYTDDEGRASYYDAEGNSLKRAFLRAPVEFRRISSNFSRSRRHPVLGRTRKHEGTDYAASTGTPIMAAGDGVVVRAGRAGGYGNLIELRHRNGVTTRYAHMSRFAKGMRAGKRVSQGQTIGYVGATGLASGPHLHYEFRINGVAKDSRKVNIGHGTALGGRQLAAFDLERSRLASLLYGTGETETVFAQGPTEPVVAN